MWVGSQPNDFMLHLWEMYRISLWKLHIILLDVCVASGLAVLLMDSCVISSLGCLWTQVYKYFQIQSFSSWDRYLTMELLYLMVMLGWSLFSTVAGSCYIPSNSGWGFCFPYILLTTLLSCRFRSGNPYRCNVLLFFWIIFSQWSMMSPRLFSCARWLFVYLLQGNAYSNLSPIVIEVVNDCVDPSHGCLVSTHSVLC